MAHDHHHHTNRDDIGVAFLINLGFTLLELVGGLLINSVAILSDSLHDFGDSLSLGLAWFLQRYSEREGDARYTYGYRRFSLLAAFINAIVLILGSLLILSQAIPRLLSPEPFDSVGMIVFAIIGVAANGYAAYRLRENQSANAQVVGWHMIEDVLGWVAVLVVGIVSLFADLPILDPILSILITLYVLFNVVSKLRRSVRLFLQAAPPDVDVDKIQRDLKAIEGVESVHHTHVWSLDGEHNVFTTHLVVPDNTPSREIMRIRADSWQAINHIALEHVTIGIEYASEACSMRP